MLQQKYIIEKSKNPYNNHNYQPNEHLLSKLLINLYFNTMPKSLDIPSKTSKYPDIIPNQP